MATFLVQKQLIPWLYCFGKSPTFFRFILNVGSKLGQDKVVFGRMYILSIRILVLRIKGRTNFMRVVSEFIYLYLWGVWYKYTSMGDLVRTLLGIVNLMYAFSFVYIYAMENLTDIRTPTVWPSEAPIVRKLDIGWAWNGRCFPHKIIFNTSTSTGTYTNKTVVFGVQRALESFTRRFCIHKMQLFGVGFGLAAWLGRISLRIRLATH